MKTEHMERICRRMHTDGLITLWGAFRNDLRDGGRGLPAHEREEFLALGRTYIGMIERVLEEKGIPREQLLERLVSITNDRIARR